MLKIQIAESYKLLARLHEKINNFNKAYKYRDSSAIMYDSIYEENRIKRATEFEEIYQNKKKQEKINETYITKLKKRIYLN